MKFNERHDRTRPWKLRQDKTMEVKTMKETEGAKQDKTRQGKVRQNKTMEVKTRQDNGS